MARILMLAFVLAALQTPGCSPVDGDDMLEVIYIGNEGFLIRCGEIKLLVDALSSSAYYVSPSDSLVARMMDGSPPFDEVDFLLVTHDHADHFDSSMVARYLQQHPGTHFIASSATCARVPIGAVEGHARSCFDLQAGGHQMVSADDVEITVLPLEHSGWPEIANLAYIIRAHGRTIVHVGDAKLSDNESRLRSLDWISQPTDLLFIEFFDRSDETESVIDSLIRPERVILMHIPGGEEEQRRRESADSAPPRVVFRRQGETMRFPKEG